MNVARQPISLLAPPATALPIERGGPAEEERVRDTRADQPADEELARAARRGDRAAFEALVRRYRHGITLFVRTLLPRWEDAEDLAQETFVRAYRGLPGYEPRGHFRSWLFGIAANVCREHHRTQRRHAVVVTGSEPIEALAAREEDPIAHSALRTAVRQAIARLPVLYRAPVVLHHLEEFAVAEVAAILGRSPSAIKVQLWRARALLARELADWLE
jgi:RNA polymerase sigma factor (sigma-70 family)